MAGRGEGGDPPEDPRWSAGELSELVLASGVLGPERSGDPAQEARVRELMEQLDPSLREGLVRRIATEDAFKQLRVRHFASAHGLTPAEAKLLQALCEGMSLVTYAEASHISPHTARTHLQRIRQKTGINRQGELVRRALE